MDAGAEDDVLSHSMTRRESSTGVSTFSLASYLSFTDLENIEVVVIGLLVCRNVPSEYSARYGARPFNPLGFKMTSELHCNRIRLN